MNLPGRRWSARHRPKFHRPKYLRGAQETHCREAVGLTPGSPILYFSHVVQSSIQVGVNGDAVWVKVEGKGSFLNSGNLKEFTREMVNRGYREFVVDLEKCAMMDSTFMGTMAGVALRLKELGHGHLHVIHCGERSRDLLCGLGLDQIFSIHANGTAAPQCELLQGKSTAESAEEKKRENARQMLDAHQALCDAAPENLSRFKDVLDYLKQDLHHETAPN
jgi:anti-sigma B factor antagonist